MGRPAMMAFLTEITEQQNFSKEITYMKYVYTVFTLIDPTMCEIQISYCSLWSSCE